MKLEEIRIQAQEVREVSMKLLMSEGWKAGEARALRQLQQLIVDNLEW